MFSNVFKCIQMYSNVIRKIQMWGNSATWRNYPAQFFSNREKTVDVNENQLKGGRSAATFFTTDPFLTDRPKPTYFCPTCPHLTHPRPTCPHLTHRCPTFRRLTFRHPTHHDPTITAGPITTLDSSPTEPSPPDPSLPDPSLTDPSPPDPSHARSPQLSLDTYCMEGRRAIAPGPSQS
jgi:hypothetical protein